MDRLALPEFLNRDDYSKGENGNVNSAARMAAATRVYHLTEDSAPQKTLTHH